MPDLVRAPMHHADHPDNACLEAFVPTSVLAAPFGHDWEELPWPFEMAMMESPEWMLLHHARRLFEDPFTTDATPETSAWLTSMVSRDVVLDWVPGTGFVRVPRRPGIDVGLVRRRDPEPRPCERVIGLDTGSSGCRVHGLAVGYPREVPGGCRLVSARVCDICWRVAHAQLRPRPGVAIRWTRECLRCRAAVDALPRWVPRPVQGAQRLLAQRHASRELMVAMGRMVDGDRAVVPWAERFGPQGRVTQAVLDGGGWAPPSPEPVVTWRAWSSAHPASAEASARSVVAMFERSLPEGMVLGVDAARLAGIVRWEMGG
ncbi:hypothetical protein [Litorihabitans aurantiacus]|uniref:Uncharacterized protein n=1 Tax=Litorihabitans aurantiacus TaxID=1930061 RepID=A0AA37XHI2_9MICO|nr:hypothetical protein [Litorihabitans aurantiacus]GMA33201.1 hypothetical protein GCM10025875_31930 [Litorihabitans aurantiacus]